MPVRLIDANALMKNICGNECGCNPEECGGMESETVVCNFHAYVSDQPTIEAEPVRHGRWNDDCTEVVCSNCKSEFSYEMLIFIARGIKSEHVDGMTCRCPKCGSYNIYGGDENG